MFNWLENIRKAPKGKKRFIAFSVALLSTGALFVVWLSVWLPDFFHGQNIAQKNDQFESPKDNFGETFSQAWSGVTSSFGQLKNIISQVSLPNNVSSSLSSALNYQSTTSASTTQTSIPVVSSTTVYISGFASTSTSATSSQKQ